jgi:spermidine/putrescine transport system substrate-binding protein
MKPNLSTASALIIGVIIGIIGFRFFTQTDKTPVAGQVYLYTWSEYISDDLIAQFSKETGIEVIITTYESNEIMYSKLKMLNGKGYDLVIPSTYFVSRMVKEGLLKPLDHSKIKFWNQLNTGLLNQDYDHENQYSLPFIWGATGIGVNTDYIDVNTISSWKDLWDEKYKNRLLLINDVREVFFIALKVLGYSGNSADPNEIKAAYELLQKLAPNVTVYNSDTPAIPFLSGEVEIGMIWNGSAYMAQQENPSITMVYPKEGAVLWMDNLSIPSGAENIQSAYKLINFLMRAEVSAQISKNIGYPTANTKAQTLLKPKLAKNRLIYPSQSVIDNGEFQSDLDEETTALYNSYWQKLKTSK